jgi:hypothetical protein
MSRALLPKRLILALCASSAFAFVLSAFAAAQQTDKTEILKKARQSYCSLKDQGLTEFRCTMLPNWEVLLADQLKSDPTSLNAAVQKLQALHFGLSLGLDGSAKVTHNEIPAENEQIASGLKQIYSGMEQMASGFFRTWSGYMMSPSLPEPSAEFQLEEIGTDYRISYKDGGADVTTTMGKDLVISVQRVKTADSDTTLKPKFKKSAKGLILVGYQASYRGVTSAETAELEVTIDYQEVNGLQLPQEILLAGSYGATAFKAKIAFTDYEATKH